MNAVIYKQGQGYWVRSLSAVFFGVIVLAAAAFGWSQAGAYDPPVTGYTLGVDGVSGAITPGETVDLLDLSLDTAEDRYVPFAVARVQSVVDKGGGDLDLLLKDINVSDERYDVTRVQRLRAAPTPGATETFRAVVRTYTPAYLFPQVYLQGGIAGLVLLVGAVAIFWFVGSKPASVDFLIATDGEMKKVNWSTRREIIGSTQVVIVAAFLIAAILFLIDIGFSRAFTAIGVLEGG